jgi:uncharacterized membrane protein YwaF
MRPAWRSLPWVIAASFCYLGAAALVDWALAVNYGFLRAKPLGQNLLTVLSPWPWYIPELIAAGIAFVLIYYLPFALVDWIRPRKAGK